MQQKSAVQNNKMNANMTKTQIATALAKVGTDEHLSTMTYAEIAQQLQKKHNYSPSEIACIFRSEDCLDDDDLGSILLEDDSVESSDGYSLTARPHEFAKAMIFAGVDPFSVAAQMRKAYPRAAYPVVTHITAALRAAGVDLFTAVKATISVSSYIESESIAGDLFDAGLSLREITTVFRSPNGLDRDITKVVSSMFSAKVSSGEAGDWGEYTRELEPKEIFDAVDPNHAFDASIVAHILREMPLDIQGVAGNNKKIARILFNLNFSIPSIIRAMRSVLRFDLTETAKFLQEFHKSPGTIVNLLLNHAHLVDDADGGVTVYRIAVVLRDGLGFDESEVEAAMLNGANMSKSEYAAAIAAAAA